MLRKSVLGLFIVLVCCAGLAHSQVTGQATLAPNLRNAKYLTLQITGEPARALFNQLAIHNRVVNTPYQRYVENPEGPHCLELLQGALAEFECNIVIDPNGAFSSAPPTSAGIGVSN